MSGRRIRILFVTDQLEIGGAEKQLVELLNRIDKKQFEIFLFCTVSGGYWQETCERHGIRVVVHRQSGSLDFAVVFKLAQFLRKHRIQILHSWLWYSNILCFVATRFVHVSLWLLSVRGIPLGLTRLHVFIERLANRFADHITAVSDFNRRVLREIHGVPSRKVSVIYNGIDLSPPQSGFLEDKEFADFITDSRPLLGCIATFKLEKGHRYLVEAMPEVTRRFPEVHLLLVGDGPLCPSIESQVEALGLSDCVHLLGMRTDIPKILSSLQLLVLPSVLEGTPNVILEAMALQVPVVATRVGGIPELVDDGVTGLLVPPRNPQALTEAILWMLRHPERRKDMAKAGYHRAKTRFGLQRMVRSYEQLYFEMLCDE